MKLLLCTNGSESSQAALQFGVILARTLRYEATVLGVIETPVLQQLIETQTRWAVEQISAANIPCETNFIVGNALSIVPTVADKGDFLTVIGSLGRTIPRRLFRGRTISHLLEEMESPIVYVRTPPQNERLERILICSGGLHFANAAVDFGGQIAKAAQAEVTLFHVATPLPNMPKPVRDVRATPSEVYLQGENIYARNLRQQLANLQSMDLYATFKLESGDPLMQIMAEVRSGRYDLIVIGSHTVMTGPARLVGDIMHRIVEGSNQPVLVVKGPSNS